MPEAWQGLTFELLEHFDPEWAALASGFAVIVSGVLHLTPAGERYLERLDQ